MSNNNNLQLAAAELAGRGLRVFPLHGIVGGHCTCNAPACYSPGKHPRINDWKEKATCEREQVNKLWAQFSNANIGVATGQGSGVVVVDIDGEAGESTMNGLSKRYGSLPDTLAALSGRGMHLYFKAPPDTPLGNHVGKLGPGIDIRGEGGYVVAPPSRHHNGTIYSWLNLAANIAPMPDWIIQLLNEPKQERAQAETIDRIVEGNRNDTLFKIGASMRGTGHTETEIATTLSLVNQEQCDPPLPDHELMDIAKSAATYAPGKVVAWAEMKNRLWWFPIDVNEWCTDRRLMFLKDYQVGWLIWLRIEAWKTKGILPNNPDELAVLARASSRKRFHKENAAVKAFFEQTANGTEIFDPELVAYWQQKTTDVEKNRRAGRASGQRRRELQAQSAEPEMTTK